MKRLGIYLLVFVTLFSCSEYQEALKSEDIGTKFKLAEDLYEAEKWGKANRLFAQLVPSYRGKPQAQRLMYMYAMSFYKLRDYTLAAYQFDRFEDSYPTSEKVEEAAFLAAKSYYQLSPIYSKEQEETVEAIEKLQLFVNKFPESEYLEEANALVNELDLKLERKAFEIAKLYNKTAYYDSSDYEAAIKSFDNFLIDYPASSFREDAMFYRLDSSYKLGINSVRVKQLERLKNAKDHYNTLMRYYPDTKYMEEAEEMNQQIEATMSQINTTQS